MLTRHYLKELMHAFMNGTAAHVRGFEKLYLAIGKEAQINCVPGLGSFDNLGIVYSRACLPYRVSTKTDSYTDIQSSCLGQNEMTAMIYMYED